MKKDFRNVFLVFGLILIVLLGGSKLYAYQEADAVRIAEVYHSKLQKSEELLQLILAQRAELENQKLFKEQQEMDDLRQQEAEVAQALADEEEAKALAMAKSEAKKRALIAEAEAIRIAKEKANIEAKRQADALAAKQKAEELAAKQARDLAMAEAVARQMSRRSRAS